MIVNVTVRTKVLSLSNSKNSNNNSIKQALQISMKNTLSNKSPCYATQGFFKVRCHTNIEYT